MVSVKPGTIRRITGLTGFREGSFVNHRNGTYYLSYSIDDTGSPNYRVGYATSTSVDGPWTYRGLLLEKDESQGILATGHSSIIQVPGTDDWYIAYHRFAMPGGDGTHRETTIDRLYFNADGTMRKVAPTLSSVDPLRYEGSRPVGEVSHAGADGWYGAGAELTLTGDPTITAMQYRLADGAWTTYAAPVALPEGSYRIAYRARGVNLQWSQAWTLPVQVDATAPGVTWRAGPEDGSSHVFGTVPDAPTCEAVDTLSGPAACVVSGYSPSVGTHTLTATATDRAGNTTAVTRTYPVTAWTLTGFTGPVDDGVANTVKGGSTVPLMFQVFAGDRELTATSAVDDVVAQVVDCATRTPDGQPESIRAGLTYTDEGFFQVVWRTPRRPGACYRVRVGTVDGSSIQAVFLLR